MVDYILYRMEWYMYKHIDAHMRISFMSLFWLKHLEAI